MSLVATRWQHSITYGARLGAGGVGELTGPGAERPRVFGIRGSRAGTPPGSPPPGTPGWQGSFCSAEEPQPGRTKCFSLTVSPQSSR